MSYGLEGQTVAAMGCPSCFSIYPNLPEKVLNCTCLDTREAPYEPATKTVPLTISIKKVENGER